MDYTESTTTRGSIIRVSFFEPVDNKTDYFFGSLKAIFHVFTPEQVGCTLPTLYFTRLTLTKKKVTDKCVISKETVTRTKHKQDGKQEDSTQP